MSYVCFNSLKAMCIILVFVVATTAVSAQQQYQNTVCPFDYILHLGDGFFDPGNSVRMKPYGPYLPPTRLPYGQTFPGRPAGRWSDGGLDPDHSADSLGFKGTVPYLGGKFPPGYSIMFAVARSPILDRNFFLARNVRIPAFAAPLSVQMSWVRKYLDSVASTPQAIADILGNTMFFFGDTESNDLAYPLTQGKSFQEVQSYIPYVVEAQINAARELAKMGATRVVIPGGFPIGCYPYILTELASENPDDYDEMGCLKTVNDLIQAKDDALLQAINALQLEFPDYWIQYGNIYEPLMHVINASFVSGSNNTLQACCGVGGKYNFNSKRPCGSPGVSVCSDPSQYIFWDGYFLTDEGNYRVTADIESQTLPILNCTSALHLLDFFKPRLSSSI